MIAQERKEKHQVQTHNFQRTQQLEDAVPWRLVPTMITYWSCLIINRRSNCRITILFVSLPQCAWCPACLPPETQQWSDLSYWKPPRKMVLGSDHHDVQHSLILRSVHRQPRGHIRYQLHHHLLSASCWLLVRSSRHHHSHKLVRQTDVLVCAAS